MVVPLENHHQAMQGKVCIGSGSGGIGSDGVSGVSSVDKLVDMRSWARVSSD